MANDLTSLSTRVRRTGELNGLWTVRFERAQAHASAIVVLLNGQLLGGDSGFFYTGSYEMFDEVFRARIAVTQYDSTVSGPFRFERRCVLILEGKIGSDTVSGAGIIAADPTTTYVITLTRQIVML